MEAVILARLMNARITIINIGVGSSGMVEYSLTSVGDENELSAALV